MFCICHMTPLTKNFISERATDPETASEAWKAAILPLNYTRVTHNIKNIFVSAYSYAVCILHYIIAVHYI